VVCPGQREKGLRKDFDDPGGASQRWASWRMDGVGRVGREGIWGGGRSLRSLKGGVCKKGWYTTEMEYRKGVDSHSYENGIEAAIRRASLPLKGHRSRGFHKESASGR